MTSKNHLPFGCWGWREKKLELFQSMPSISDFLWELCKGQACLGGHSISTFTHEQQTWTAAFAWDNSQLVKRKNEVNHKSIWQIGRCVNQTYAVSSLYSIQSNVPLPLLLFRTSTGCLLCCSPLLATSDNTLRAFPSLRSQFEQFQRHSHDFKTCLPRRTALFGTWI